MPKLKESPQQHMDRAFRAALKAGQERRGEKHADTAKLAHIALPTYYYHVREPRLLRFEDVRIIAQRYLNDRQLCEACGVEYHGSTPE